MFTISFYYSERDEADNRKVAVIIREAVMHTRLAQLLYTYILESYTHISGA